MVIPLHHVNAELQARVLDGKEAITCRPADLLDPEMDKLSVELQQIADEKNITLAEDTIDDVLTYALFPQIGLKFLENRNNPDAFEPAPTKASANKLQLLSGWLIQQTPALKVTRSVLMVKFMMWLSHQVVPLRIFRRQANAPAPTCIRRRSLKAPLAGNIFKVLVKEGDDVEEGEVVIIMEAMKMETEIRATKAGEISAIHAREGDSVAVGDALLSLV